MDGTVPSTLGDLLLRFAPMFSAPSFANFVAIVTGWMVCTGRHTLTRIITRGGGRARKKHPSSLYRFLARACWSVDEVAQVVFQLALPWIPGFRIVAVTDDTLCRKSGPHIWGAAMHHDPLTSTYGRGSKAGAHRAFAFGHNWVVLSLWVPCPWNPDRGCSIPILWRLYRGKKRCPRGEYRKRTELALELIRILATWVPADRLFFVVADTEYACRTVLRGLPKGVNFVGPLPMDAELYAVPHAPSGGCGRPRVRGERLPNPKDMAWKKGLPWERKELALYGRQIRVRIKSWTCVWYHPCGSRPVRVVLTRDPTGRIDDRAYFCTDVNLPPLEILQTFARRWSIEETFRACKQHLGLKDPQNGWWRRRAGCRPRRLIPGPQPHAHRGRLAVERTVPIGFTVYALVALWYFRHGPWRADVKRAQAQAPWYRHKAQPSFADMLKAIGRELWHARFLANPSLRMVPPKTQRALCDWLLAA